MDRRSFIRRGALVTGAIAVAPLVPAEWTATASAASRIPKPIISGVKEIGKLAWEIAKEVIKENAVGWINERIHTPWGEAGRKGKKELQGTGYTVLTQLPVFQANNNVLLGFVNAATKDVQMQVIFPPSGRSCPFCFVGGPAIPLLSQTVSDLRSEYGLANSDLAAYLLPTEPVTRNVGLMTYAQRWSARYPTEAGSVAMTYSFTIARTITAVVAIDVYDRSQRAFVWSEVYDLPVT